jgi:hypothetical protein
VPTKGVLESGCSEHSVDERIASGYHIRIAPDEVTNGGLGCWRGERRKRRRNLLSHLVGLLRFSDQFSYLTDHCQRIIERTNVGDVNGIMALKFFNLFTGILFFIGQDKVRPSE